MTFGLLEHQDCDKRENESVVSEIKLARLDFLYYKCEI